ncbi:nephrin-like [Stegodyphus dumicola]|uniref:nephrin-like n=1 Tax=Stegodyphus dumicola TaxID=202533 RepID=UPI0015B2DA78|nr:nephrin-like [Stegodyphus dumicola]
MQAVSGGRLSLPCDITSPISDDEVYLVLWYKDEVATPIYSLDARRGQLGQARHATSETLTGRAYFSSVPQPAVLQIDKVSLEDEGLYRCRVDFRKARTQHSALSVTVVVPPGAPIIKDYNGKVLSAVIGPYNEGDSLHLICQAEGGKPPPSLMWWRGRRIIDDSYETPSLGTTRNELYIEKLQRRDLMATLTCQAANNNISPHVEASVTLDINFRPQSVHVKGKRKKLSAKKTVQFECEAKGSRPPSVISWRKGSYKLKSAVSRVLAQGNITTSTLTITPTSDDNGKFLYCQADNPAIPGSAIEDGWKLDVHYVPQLNLRLGSKLRHSNILEDMDVYFECNIRANPWVSETGWRFEGYDLQNNLTAGVVISNQSLVLQKVNRNNRGRYSCTATNSEGQGESNHVYLRVQYSPVCKPDQESNYSALLSHPVEIPCEIEADPDDVNFRWEFNGTSAGGDQQVIPIHGSTTRSVLNYIPRSELDFGIIFCWGKNTVGPQRNPCVFYVNPAEPPNPVYNCSVTDQMDRSIKILCNASTEDSAGLMEYFYIEITSSGELLQNFSSDIPEFTVKGLNPGTTYSAFIYVSNDAGRSKPVIIEVQTNVSQNISTVEGDVWDIDSSPIIFTAIAVAGSVILVGLIITLVLKLRLSRRSSKDSLSAQGNEKSAHNSEKSGDSCSEGCTCSREEEKIRENIPDVVVFSEKAKSEEEDRMKASYSPKSSYWNPITLSSEQEMLPQAKMKACF